MPKHTDIKATLQYCLSVFQETCDCRSCGPCRSKSTIRQSIKQVKNTVTLDVARVHVLIDGLERLDYSGMKLESKSQRALLRELRNIQKRLNREQ